MCVYVCVNKFSNCFHGNLVNTLTRVDSGPLRGSKRTGHGQQWEKADQWNTKSGQNNFIFHFTIWHISLGCFSNEFIVEFVAFVLVGAAVAHPVFDSAVVGIVAAAAQQKTWSDHFAIYKPLSRLPCLCMFLSSLLHYFIFIDYFALLLLFFLLFVMDASTFLNTRLGSASVHLFSCSLFCLC